MDLCRHIAATAMLIGMTSCATNDQPRSAKNDAQPEPKTEREYHIGVDDVVAVNVWRDPELSVTMPVRPDGKITVPLVGDVQAGGRTPPDVAKDIRQRLAAFIRNPDVTVILTELHSHEYLSRIRVTGAVTTPLSLPYRQGMTALDAILEAGGLSPFAAPDRAKVYRRNGDNGTKVLAVHLGRILSRGDLSTNVDLLPGDVVTIPERLF